MVTLSTCINKVNRHYRYRVAAAATLGDPGHPGTLAFFFFIADPGGLTLNTASHVEQMGLNLQKTERHTEHTKPTSTSSRWQKQAAR